MNLYSKLSLSKKMIFQCLLSLGVICGLNYYQFLGLTERSANTVKEGYHSEAVRLQRAIAMELSERYGEVQDLAQNEVFRGEDTSKMTSVLNKYAFLHPNYDLIAYVDMRGELVASNTRAPGGAISSKSLYGYKFSDSPWFKAVMNEKYTEDAKKGLIGTYVEDAQWDPLLEAAFNKPRFGNGFSTVVKDPQGQIIGVLTARSNFRWVENHFKTAFLNIAESATGSKAAELTLMNGKGFVIVDHDPARRDGKNEANRDPEVLGKLNLVNAGVESAKAIKDGKSGIMESIHARKQISQQVGYTPVTDSDLLASFGWGVLVRLPTTAAMDVFKAIRSQYLWTLGVSVGLLFFAMLWLTSTLSKSLVSSAQGLSMGVEANQKICKEMQNTAGEVANTSCEQASAIQESVSALSEMNSMVALTSNNAKNAFEAAQSTASRASEGKNTMSKMVESMSELQNSNKNLQDVGTIINNIYGKTGVINDIVFKTQLLSFNASIEAARAGQHGRGFAVVAEEVGNLAQLSGKAANEIESLLKDSQKQVSALLEVIEKRVQEGTLVTHEAVNAFNQISENVQAVSNQLKGISEATEQQQLGIQQTQTAMTQLENSAQRASQMAQNSAGLTRDFAVKNTKMEETIGGLYQFVVGLSMKRQSGSSTIAVKESLQEIEVPQQAASNVIPIMPSQLHDFKSASIDANHDSFKKSA